MISINRELLLDGMPDAALLGTLLAARQGEQQRMQRLRDLYERRHAISTRQRPKGLPNNRLAHDLPGYIAAMAAGYLVGSPVRYAAPAEAAEAFETVRRAYDAACVESVDAELAVDAAVYGRAVELCYADASARPRVAQLDAITSFVVYDDTVEHAPLFGVCRHDLTDRQLRRRGERVSVYGPAWAVHYERTGSEIPREVGRERHWFGGVPMVEYWNNAREQGDFEPVADLIDAYDALQSDRVNDKQQFTDALFVLKGVGALGAEDGDPDEPPSVRLRRTRTLFLPGDGADAQFVTKPDAESGNELLRRSLQSDIHKLSMVPDLTDEQFAGNVSGVAMRFKLLGLEQLTKIKERWFREGLRTRLRLFCAFLASRGEAPVDADRVLIQFSRTLPVNELEIAQTLKTYEGLVPTEQLLAQVPFLENGAAAEPIMDRKEEEHD